MLRSGRRKIRTLSSEIPTMYWNFPLRSYSIALVSGFFREAYVA